MSGSYSQHHAVPTILASPRGWGVGGGAEKGYQDKQQKCCQQGGKGWRQSRWKHYAGQDSQPYTTHKSTKCLYPPFLEIIFELHRGRSESFKKYITTFAWCPSVSQEMGEAVLVLIKEQMNSFMRTEVWKTVHWDWRGYPAMSQNTTIQLIHWISFFR